MVDEYISIARAREIFLEGLIAPKDIACPYEKRNERLMWEAGRLQAVENASSGVKDAIHDGAVGQPTNE
jgi:ribosome modulation factor